jgi:hypothetical protein
MPTWHHAINNGPLKLMKAYGGGSDLKLVERYAHLMLAGHENAIRRFSRDV